MTDDELIDYMDEHNITGKQFNSTIHSNFKKAVLERTAFLDGIKGRLNPSVRMWCIRHHITEVPLCHHPDCNTPVKASLVKQDDKSIYRLSKFCSNLCSNRHPDNIQKRVDANPLKTEEGKKSLKRTYQQRAKDMGLDNWEHYTHSSHFDDIKEKRMNTMFENYGCHNMQSDEGMNEFKDSLLKKYGVDRVSDIDGVREKTKTTVSMFTDERKEEINTKRQQTWNDRYGGHPMRNDDVLNKLRLSNIEKYGRENHTQQHISESSLEILNDKTKLQNLYDNMKFLQPIADYLEVSFSAVQRACTRLEVDVSHIHMRSIAEMEIEDILNNLGFEVEIGRRDILSSGEIDLYIPSMKIGIEYNGLYWHSDKFRFKTFHQDKALEAMDKGILLIQVWEDDWKDETKKNIIINKIKTKLGIVGNRVFGRKTSVFIPSTESVRQFLEDNHIQGYVDARYIGLKDSDGCMVACMGFKRMTNGVWDLVRYATSVSVLGGLSKLLSHFKKSYDWKEIITYAHLDYSHGDVYEKTGFMKEHITVPGLWYVKGDKRYRREKFMKHKLPHVLEAFDSSLTERENMVNHGFNRLYDCGSIRYSIKNDS